MIARLQPNQFLSLRYHELHLPAFQITCGVTRRMQWTMSIAHQVCISMCVTYSYARLMHVSVLMVICLGTYNVQYLVWDNTIKTLVLNQFVSLPSFLQTSENEIAVAPLQNVFRCRTSKTFQLRHAPPYEFLEKVLIRKHPV